MDIHRYVPRPPRIDIRSKIIDTEDWAEGGKWVLVSSSNVHAIRYDMENRILYVQFGGKKLKKGGYSKISTYRYYSVPAPIAKGLFMAPSIGKYLHYRIKKEGYAVDQVS